MLKPAQVASRPLQVHVQYRYRWHHVHYRYRTATGTSTTGTRPPQVQVASRPQVSEQSCIEDDDIVSFARSNAHTFGPFLVFLNPLYDVAVTEFRRDVTGVITSSSSSSGDRNNETNIICMTVFCLLTDKTYKQNKVKFSVFYFQTSIDVACETSRV